MSVWAFLDHQERATCQRLNRWSRRRKARTAFAVVSRLGDGVFWYALMLAMLAAGGAAMLEPVAKMLLSGGAGLAVYTLLKRRLARERPWLRHPGIELAAAPLDRYSFPSGHTLHAVLFTVWVAALMPQWLWIALPFAVLVGLSRVILGLHYPSDVLAGAALGYLVARITLLWL